MYTIHTMYTKPHKHWLCRQCRAVYLVYMAEEQQGKTTTKRYTWYTSKNHVHHPQSLTPYGFGIHGIFGIDVFGYVSFFNQHITIFNTIFNLQSIKGILFR